MSAVLTEREAVGGMQDTPDKHLACGCRPKITHCGSYVACADGVDWIEDESTVCKDCLRVWYSGGCPSCSCRPEAICVACHESAAN